MFNIPITCVGITNLASFQWDIDTCMCNHLFKTWFGMQVRVACLHTDIQVNTGTLCHGYITPDIQVYTGTLCHGYITLIYRYTQVHYVMGI